MLDRQLAGLALNIRRSTMIDHVRSWNGPMLKGYDLVGDIQSQDDTLLRFLEFAGYERFGATFHHPSRKAIVLGNFAEGGPVQKMFIDCIKNMVDPTDYSAVLEKRRFLVRCDLGGLICSVFLPAEKNGDWRLAKVGRLEPPTLAMLRGLAIESMRESHRPETVTTLFIGESAPDNGTFFYNGENSMLREMRGVMETWENKSLGNSGQFLEAFKALGWYLDDLVLTPVNKLSKPERRGQCRAAIDGLAKRIEHNKPQAIVVLLLSIEPFVKSAAIAAGSTAKIHAVPFPGMGNAHRFRARMAEIVASFPVAK